MEFPDPKLKRKRSISLDRNTVYRLNKRRLRFGTISIPVNDEYGYEYALVTCHVYPLPPSDNELMKFAVENDLLNRVVYGTGGNKVIEGLIVDEETGRPWQIPKVTIGYRRIDYSSSMQLYTEQSARYEEPPVSPKTIGGADSAGSLEELRVC